MAALEATPWGTDTWANLTDWRGADTTGTGTLNLWGDPAFVDAAAADYHLTSHSAAIGVGIEGA